jgi:hypothetical protein
MTFVIPLKKSGKNVKLPFGLLLFILLLTTDFAIAIVIAIAIVLLLSLSCIPVTHQRHKTDNGHSAERHDNRGHQR